jgi:hypothetical protein
LLLVFLSVFPSQLINTKESSYIVANSKKKGWGDYSYNPLKASWMSLVFFAALVNLGGCLGPFVRFIGGPVDGLVVHRFLIWAHCARPRQ